MSPALQGRGRSKNMAEHSRHTTRQKSDEDMKVIRDEDGYGRILGAMGHKMFFIDISIPNFEHQGSKGL